MNRVAVTGMGVVSPLGNDCRLFFHNLAAGRSGISRLDQPFSSRLAAPVAATVQFDPAQFFPAPKLRMLDRVSQFALHAAAQAVADAGLPCPVAQPQRAGVFIGTGLGGAHTMDDSYRMIYGQDPFGQDGDASRIKPLSVLMAMNNAAAGWIAIEYGLAGPSLTYSNACSSSALAIGEAARRIAAGEADLMLAGGSEAALTFGVLKAWEALRVLASVDPDDAAASCKPFSANRSGLVLGEGAAIVVLEEWQCAIRRGARIHAELSGYGLSTDCAHLTRPSVEGQARAMRLALASAGLGPDAIGCINAHGSATQANDAVETAAIRQVFGAGADRVPVSATKALHGHLLGAAGALEFVASVMALETGTIPPTMHLQVADPECDLDYVPLRARSGQKLGAVMSNSFAFGGTNAVLVACAADRSGG